MHWVLVSSSRYRDAVVNLLRHPGSPNLSSFLGYRTKLFGQFFVVLGFVAAWNDFFLILYALPGLDIKVEIMKRIYAIILVGCSAVCTQGLFTVVRNEAVVLQLLSTCGSLRRLRPVIKCHDALFLFSQCVFCLLFLLPGSFFYTYILHVANKSVFPSSFR